MENGFDDEELFPAALLAEIDFEVEKKASYNPSISPSHPGESLVLRPLHISDYEKGYIEVLRQLTKCGDIAIEDFEAQFNHMKTCPNTYFITVLEDTTTRQIIGTSTLFIERKFIHHCATRGRIEDVVVNEKYRGKQLGKLLVETMTLLGKHLGVYKMTLECRHKNVGFYENFGYINDGDNNFMYIRYKD